MKSIITYVLFTSLMVISQLSWSQRVALEEIIDFALAQNLSIKASEAKINYSQSLIPTARSIPKTNMEMQYGNIQIPNVADYVLSISQPFQNPKVNKAREELFEKYVQEAFTLNQVEVLSVKRDIRKTYYQTAYYSSLLDLLSSRDTLYSKAMRRAEVRFRAGETSILEKTNLETQKEALLNKISVTQYNLERSQNELKRLTQWDGELIIETGELNKDLLIEKLNYSSPLFDGFQRLKEINTAEKKLTSASLKPDYFAGITNQSMDRSFSQFVIMGGINIPIFQKAEKAKIASYEFQQSVIETQEQAFQNSIQGAFDKLVNQLRSIRKEQQYLSDKALPRTQLIIDTAQKQYLQGAINYLEYQQNFIQAFELEEQYLMKLLEQKNIETELFYLLGK